MNKDFFTTASSASERFALLTCAGLRLGCCWLWRQYRTSKKAPKQKRRPMSRQLCFRHLATRLKMIECIFTLDYEIYGDGTGSLNELVYEPTERLRVVFEKRGVRFVSFVE